MKLLEVCGLLALATTLTIAPVSCVFATGSSQDSGIQTNAELDPSSRSIVQVQIEPGSPAFEWVRSQLAGQAARAERLTLRIEYAEGYSPDHLELAQFGLSQPTSTVAKTNFDVSNPPRPTGSGRTIDQRTTVTEFCQSYVAVNGVTHTADIEYHYAWRKPRDSQGRVIEDAEPEWTLVGITVKEAMPLMASTC
ncbi:MAG: hypothetical protein H4O13_12710 [Xanthomonadales bacterium]|nr:hypothetical protein [Xanthomonadales bacterium]